MFPSIYPARLAALPADLQALFSAQAAMLEAERRRADDERHARLHVESEPCAFKEIVARLELLVKEYERTRFGKRSEKFDPIRGLIPVRLEGPTPSLRDYCSGFYRQDVAQRGRKLLMLGSLLEIFDQQIADDT